MHLRSRKPRCRLDFRKVRVKSSSAGYTVASDARRRRAPGQAAARPAGGPISSLYTSHPPSAFDKRKSAHARYRPSQRRKEPTTFNVMVRCCRSGSLYTSPLTRMESRLWVPVVRARRLSSGYSLKRRKYLPMRRQSSASRLTTSSTALPKPHATFTLLA